MSSNVIVLKRNARDDAKVKNLRSTNPASFLTYDVSGSLHNLARDFGSKDYMLFTGGHGDFRGSKPTKFNDTTIDDLKNFAQKSTGQFKTIVLDTCFSSAVAPIFLPFVPYGGSIVCAHGSGEGWAEAFTDRNGAKSIGSVLADVVDGMSGLDCAPSIGLILRKPRNTLLYTLNAGTGRVSNLANRGNYGMDADTPLELLQLDTYLFGNQITTVETKDAPSFKALLTGTLTTTVM